MRTYISLQCRRCISHNKRTYCFDNNQRWNHYCERLCGKKYCLPRISSSAIFSNLPIKILRTWGKSNNCRIRIDKYILTTETLMWSFVHNIHTTRNTPLEPTICIRHVTWVCLSIYLRTFFRNKHGRHRDGKRCCLVCKNTLWRKEYKEDDHQ